MPRELRIKGDDIQYHLILRCNNKEPLIKERADFEMLLYLLEEVKCKFETRIYNYEFLNAHIHLMLSTHQNFFVDEIMHSFCFKYAKDYNKRHKRNGHFWAHRYRSRIILNDQHGLGCLRYQHRNALSAGLVAKPEDWPWSGYRFYVYGEPNSLLDYHPSFLALGESEMQRRISYQKLVETPIPADKWKGLLEKGNGLMTQRFLIMLKQVERLKNRHLVPGTI